MKLQQKQKDEGTINEGRVDPEPRLFKRKNEKGKVFYSQTILVVAIRRSKSSGSEEKEKVRERTKERIRKRERDCISVCVSMYACVRACVAVRSTASPWFSRRGGIGGTGRGLPRRMGDGAGRTRNSTYTPATANSRPSPTRWPISC